MMIESEGRVICELLSTIELNISTDAIPGVKGDYTCILLNCCISEFRYPLYHGLLGSVFRTIVGVVTSSLLILSGSNNLFNSSIWEKSVSLY